ncbi:MAG: hypothetical protein LUO79_00155 [Methanomassiliicoccales archaeon]|nr:hypothetical protein [Methanomassiliicoccales archaeon]
MARASGPRKPCRMAVSSLGNTLDDKVGSLARSKYFFIFEGSPEKFTVVENPSRAPGVEAGLMTAKALIENKVNIVITGTIGRRAYGALKEAGTSVKAGCTGSVFEAVRRCAAGELEECKGATYAGYLGI